MQEVGLQVGDVRQRGPWKPARRSHLIHHDHEDIRLVVALGDVRRAHKWVGGRLLGRHRRRYYSRRQGGRIGGHYIAERVLVKDRRGGGGLARGVCPSRPTRGGGGGAPRAP